MEGIKKLVLVGLVAPVFSVHGLEFLDDTDLSSVTGQSGVTIDLETQINIGSVTWADTASNGAAVVPSAPSGGAAGGSSGVSGMESAGITIDLETEVSIGSIAWTDTQTQADLFGAGIGGGSVVIQGISVGGFDSATGVQSGPLKDVRLNIDAGENVRIGSSTMLNKAYAGGYAQYHLIGYLDAVSNAELVSSDPGSSQVDINNANSQVDAAAASLTLHQKDVMDSAIATGDVDRVNATVGSLMMLASADTADVVTGSGKDALQIQVRSTKGQTINLGVAVDEVYMGGWSGNLMSDFSMNMVLGPQDIVIYEDAYNYSHIDMSGYFKVTDMDVTMDVLGMGLENVAIGSINFEAMNSADFASGNYQFYSGALGERLVVSYLEAFASGDQRAIDKAVARVEANSSVTAADLDADPNAIFNLLASANLNEGASGHARYALDISTEDVLGLNGAASVTDALSVNVRLFQADIGIGAINIGGHSLGSLAVENLLVTDTQLTIYGH